MTRIAKEEHKYYPADWLSKEQSEALLKENGYTVNVTMDWCKRNSVQVSGTGHLWKVSLDLLIKSRKFEEQQEELYS